MYARGVPKVSGAPIIRYSRITPEIFVGPQHGPRGLRELSELGVTGCVNMRVEYDDAARGVAFAKYCHLPTEDDAAPTLEQLRQGVAFIEKEVAAGGKVYIHCAGGVGRAPTMAAAYFISQGMSLEEAIALIKKARPFIDLTPPQLARLREFASTVVPVAGEGSPVSETAAS